MTPVKRLHRRGRGRIDAPIPVSPMGRGTDSLLIPISPVGRGRATIRASEPNGYLEIVGRGQSSTFRAGDGRGRGRTTVSPALIERALSGIKRTTPEDQFDDAKSIGTLSIRSDDDAGPEGSRAIDWGNLPSPDSDSVEVPGIPWKK